MREELGMREFPLELQLNVDASADHANEVAHLWLTELSAAVAADERRDLASLPARSRLVGGGVGPLGPEGTLVGTVEVQRWHDDRPPTGEKRLFSDEGLRWLRGRVADDWWRVHAWIGRLDETGQHTGDLFSASVRTVKESPGWLMLSATFPSSRFFGPDASVRQRWWLEAARSVADQLNPGYGQFSYYSAGGATSWEWAAPRALPFQQRRPEYRIGGACETLRGYAWLTIVAQQQADRLGGTTALADTGAFVEVRQLASGGVWLLATEDFRDYDIDVARRIVGALAPLMPPGLPREVPSRDFDPPLIVVHEDPAQRRTSTSG
jgi:hypothetical protein